jgi:xanthine dehydrogenase YagR molybdenum-binding subunit
LEAVRRLGQPVEASVDSKPGDASQRFSMHAFGAVFVEVAVDPDLGQSRVRRIMKPPLPIIPIWPMFR